MLLHKLIQSLEKQEAISINQFPVKEIYAHESRNRLLTNNVINT